MRVLHWTESFWPRTGGAERMAGLLAEEMVRRGHESVVFSDTAGTLPARDTWHGVRIRRFPCQATLARRDLTTVIALAREMAGAVRELAPDVVHVHSSQPSAFFFLRSRHAHAVPAIYTTHDPPILDAGGSQLLAEILEIADAVAAVSPFMHRETARMFPAIAGRIHTIVNALPAPDRDPVPLPWRPPVILGAGRLTGAKGFDVLLHAAARVRRQRPDVKLVIAGDGEHRRGLESLAADLGIEHTVSFAGPVSYEEMATLIERSTIVVVPSRGEEPFGLIALEAMQRRRPVIASRTGGLPDVLGDTGVLVDRDRPEALATAIEMLLDDRARTVSVGREGGLRARAAFDWTRCAESYESLYRTVAG